MWVTNIEDLHYLFVLLAGRRRDVSCRKDCQGLSRIDGLSVHCRTVEGVTLSRCSQADVQRQDATVSSSGNDEFSINTTNCLSCFYMGCNSIM